jgi:hypothetical protein
MNRRISDGLREYRLRAELLRGSHGETGPGEFGRLQRRTGHDRPWHVALRKCQPGEPHLAYDLQRYQFQPLDWMFDSRYDVVARVGPGTTKEQFRQMQQDLLVERFHLQFHYEPKEMPVSEISVVKRGLLKESAAAAPEKAILCRVPRVLSMEACTGM